MFDAGWLGSRSAGCVRTLQEVHAVESAAETHRRKESSSVSYCRVRNPSSGKSPRCRQSSAVGGY